MLERGVSASCVGHMWMHTIYPSLVLQVQELTPSSKLVSHTTPLAVPCSGFRYRADTKRVYHALSYLKQASSFLICAKVPWPQGFDLLLPLRSDSPVATNTAYPWQLSSLPSSISWDVTSSQSPSQIQQLLYSSHITLPTSLTWLSFLPSRLSLP